MKNILLISSLVLVLCATALPQQTGSDSALAAIEASYNSGQYLSAELDARRMFEQNSLRDSVKVQLDKWIAFSLIAQGKIPAAKERFVSLLKIDDTFELDPVLTSPKILAVFNDARGAFIAIRKAAAADSSRGLAQTTSASINPVTFRTIAFPGWEQLHQGRTQAGYVMLGAGIVSLTSGIVFEVLRSDARDDYMRAVKPADIASNYDSYNTYRKAEFYSFAAFAAIYIFSEIDVFQQNGLSVTPMTSLRGDHSLRFSLNF
jgi:hypothetical protein